MSDVLSLTAEQIRPAEFAVTLSAEYLTGLGALGERMRSSEISKKLLNSEEMALLDIAASHVARNNVAEMASRHPAIFLRYLPPAVRVPVHRSRSAPAFCAGTSPAATLLLSISSSEQRISFCKSKVITAGADNVDNSLSRKVALCLAYRVVTKC